MATIGPIYSSHISNGLANGGEESINKSSSTSYSYTNLYTLFAKNAFDAIPDGSTINQVRLVFSAKQSRSSTSLYIARWRLNKFIKCDNWDGTYNGFDNWNSSTTKTQLNHSTKDTDILTSSYKEYTFNISDVANMSYITVDNLKSGIAVFFQAAYHGTLSSTLYIKNFHIYVDYTPPVTYYLDLNGMLDGTSSGGISPYGTADIYINGSLVGEGVSDYYAAHISGSTYEIKNIKANDGYRYDGVYSGSLSGTLTSAISVVLSFSTRVPCTITYNGNGATGGSVSAQSGYIGESLTLSENDFTKRYIVEFEKNYIGGMDIGYQESSGFFRGWYTAAEGGTKIGDGGASYTPTGNITLYAHWSEMQAITFPTPTRDRYTFLGWYTSAEGGTKIGDGGAKYTPTGHITLYAHWKLNEITDIYIGTSILDVYIGTSKCDVYQGTTKIYG